MHVNHTTHVCKGRRRTAPLYASPYMPAMVKHRAIPAVMRYGSYTASDYRNQKVMFSLTWMFGQQQYVKHRNVGNLDESSRLGSGGGVGQ